MNNEQLRYRVSDLQDGVWSAHDEEFHYVKLQKWDDSLGSWRDWLTFRSEEAARHHALNLND